MEPQRHPHAIHGAGREGLNEQPLLTSTLQQTLLLLLVLVLMMMMTVLLLCPSSVSKAKE